MASEHSLHGPCAYTEINVDLVGYKSSRWDIKLSKLGHKKLAAVATPLGFPANVAALLTLSNTRCEECMAAYGLTLPLDADNVVA